MDRINLVSLAIFLSLLLIPLSSATTYTVCSAGCDFTTLQGCLNSIKNTAHTCEVNESGFTETLSGGYFTFSITTDPIIRIKGNNVYIDFNNTILYSNRVTSIDLASSNNTILLNGAITCDVYGIKVLSSYNTTIRNFNITTNIFGIYVTSSSNNTFDNNTINSSTCLNLYGNNLVIKNNTLYSDDIGIKVYNRNITIIGNEIFGNKFGIIIEDTATNVTIQNNTFDSNNILEHVINIYSSGNNFSNNIIRNSFFDIKSVSGNSFYNNTIFSPKVSTFIKPYIGFTNINSSVVCIYDPNGNPVYDFYYSSNSYPSINLSKNGNCIVTSTDKKGFYTIFINITDSNGNEIVGYKLKYNIFTNDYKSRKNITYYLYDDDPIHGQPANTPHDDTGSMYIFDTIETESLYCDRWIQYSIDEINITSPILIDKFYVNVWYKSSTSGYIGFEKHATYGTNLDINTSVPSATSFTLFSYVFENVSWAIENIYDLYWITLKLHDSDVSIRNDESHKSNVTIEYLESLPVVENITGNVSLLSSLLTYDNFDSYIVINGTGYANISLEMPVKNISYSVYFDGEKCNNSYCNYTQDDNKFNITIYASEIAEQKTLLFGSVNVVYYNHTITIDGTPDKPVFKNDTGEKFDTLYDCLVSINNTAGNWCTIVLDDYSETLPRSHFVISPQNLSGNYSSNGIIKIIKSNVSIDFNWSTFDYYDTPEDKSVVYVDGRFGNSNVTVENLNASAFDYAIFSGYRYDYPLPGILKLNAQNIIGNVRFTKSDQINLVNVTGSITNPYSNVGSTDGLSIVNSTGIISINNANITNSEITNYNGNITINYGSNVTIRNSNITTLKLPENSSIYDTYVVDLTPENGLYAYNITIENSGYCLNTNKQNITILSSTLNCPKGVVAGNGLSILSSSINASENYTCLTVGSNSIISGNTFHTCGKKIYIQDEDYRSSFSPIYYNGVCYNNVYFFDSSLSSSISITSDWTNVSSIVDGTSNFSLWLGNITGYYFTVYAEEPTAYDCATAFGLYGGTCDFVQEKYWIANGYGQNYTLNQSSQVSICSGYTDPPYLAFRNGSYFNQTEFPIEVIGDNNLIYGNEFKTDELLYAIENFGDNNSFWLNIFYNGTLLDNGTNTNLCVNGQGNFYEESLDVPEDDCGPVELKITTFRTGSYTTIFWKEQSSPKQVTYDVFVDGVKIGTTNNTHIEWDTRDVSRLDHTIKIVPFIYGSRVNGTNVEGTVSYYAGPGGYSPPGLPYMSNRTFLPYGILSIKFELVPAVQHLTIYQNSTKVFEGVIRNGDTIYLKPGKYMLKFEAEGFSTHYEEIDLVRPIVKRVVLEPRMLQLPTILLNNWVWIIILVLILIALVIRR